MADSKDIDTTMEDESNEEADSDFEAANVSDEISSSSAEDEGNQSVSLRRSRAQISAQAKKKEKSRIEPLELDSGDEATIREQKKAKRKQGLVVDTEPDDDSDMEDQGWRARTRAMREREEVRKKSSKLPSVKESTLDVNQMWEAMNRPGGLDDLLKPATKSSTEESAKPFEEHKENMETAKAHSTISISGKVDESRESFKGSNDMITIDETYEFAGEIHHRKKTVPKSSAEGKLWLSQRSSPNTDSRFTGDEPVRRPLRKISRFDPNINNLESFSKNWEKSVHRGKHPKPQKLNAVEKSKMDWAAHVDQEGLQDELNEHAKAKEGYLSRMDFLGKVEQRQEEEARRVRLKG